MEKRKVYKEELAKTVEEQELFAKSQPKEDLPTCGPTEL